MVFTISLVLVGGIAILFIPYLLCDPFLEAIGGLGTRAVFIIGRSNIAWRSGRVGTIDT